MRRYDARLMQQRKAWDEDTGGRKSNLESEIAIIHNNTIDNILQSEREFQGSRVELAMQRLQQEHYFS